MLAFQGLCSIRRGGYCSPGSLQLLSNLSCLRLSPLDDFEVAVVDVGSRLGRVKPFPEFSDLTIEDKVKFWAEELESTVGIIR